MGAIQRLQKRRDKLLVLAKKKRIINEIKIKAQTQENALRKEIATLRRETKRDILGMIKKKITSPAAKRDFRRAKKLFFDIKKGLKVVDKRLERLK